MEGLNRFRGSEKLFFVNENIINWNLEKRHGLAHSRIWEDYGFIELNLYELQDYKKVNKIDESIESSIYRNKNSKSIIDWKVDEKLFPTELYNLHIAEIHKYAEFIISYISALKGKELDFVFEIIFAGFHPIDSWNQKKRNSYGRALILAIVSCFDEGSYNYGLKHKKVYHSQ